MSGEEKNRLDELFKRGLENPSPDLKYHEPDWDDMEQLLDAHKKPRGVIYWLPRLGAVAAVLLAFLGWWFFKPAVVTQQQLVTVKQHPAPIPAIVNTDTIEKSASDGVIVNPQQVKGVIKKETVASRYTSNTRKRAYKTPVFYPLKSSVNPVEQSEKSAAATAPTVIASNVTAQKQASPADSSNNAAYIAKNTIPAKDIEGLAQGLDHDQAIIPAPEEPVVARGKKTGIKGSGYKPQFGLTVLASPDINGVGSFRQSQVGVNIGLVFSVSITPKLSVSTGASYSRKPYETDFSNYHTNYKFYTDPSNVYADCRVLDIPVNIDYQLYNKNRNSFSVGSGLSSYIMLKEHYKYNYAAPVAGPTAYTVVNRNQHILGVLNLNATYQRALNSRFSLAAEPYVKIPLTNIGSSQVRLRSAGVAVGFKWNINQSITP
jgi:hypothetical protein